MNAKILIVDDDPGIIQLLGRILNGLADFRFASNGEEGLRLAREWLPDLILLDAEMPGMSGFQVCEKLKANRAIANVLVIFVTAHCEVAFETAGLGLGAADFIAKPISEPRVLARVKAQLQAKRASDDLRHLTTVDALTGVANRRCLDATIEREWSRSRRTGDALALLLVDLDNFSSYNQQYGESRGDDCLRKVADALVRSSLRPADFVARHEGQKFAILLPQTPRRGAERVAHRILDTIEALDIPHENSVTSRHVTVSIGIVCFGESSATLENERRDAQRGDLHVRNQSADALLQAAGSALASAKQMGQAQARLIDFGEANAPGRAVEISPESRESRMSSKVAA
jgi:diguanylate cyclase (GGDEF)-like protein